MTIDSNTFGWLLATGIAVYVIFKYWKRFIKLVIFAAAALFVLFVIQIKEVYDVVTNADPKPKTENKRQVDVKAKYDTLTKKIEIQDIEVVDVE